MKTLTESIITDVKPLTPNTNHLLNELRISQVHTGKMTFGHLRKGDVIYSTFIGYPVKEYSIYPREIISFEKTDHGLDGRLATNEKNEERNLSLVCKYGDEFRTYFVDGDSCWSAKLTDKKVNRIVVTEPKYFEVAIKELQKRGYDTTEMEKCNFI